MDLRNSSGKFCQLNTDFSKLVRIDSVVIYFIVMSRCSDFEVIPKRRAENFVVSSQNRESFVRRNTEL